MGRDALTVQESALGCWECLSWRGCGRPGRATSVPGGRQRSSGASFDVPGRRVLLSLVQNWQRRVFSSVLQDASCRTWSQAKNERRTLRFWRRITYCELINATRPAAAVQVQQRLTSRSAAECSIIAYPQ